MLGQLRTISGTTALCRSLFLSPSLHQSSIFRPATHPSLSRRQSTISANQSNIEGIPFEEESFPGYDHEQFYPVKIGETLRSRYTVLGKLGFGANSTVWLCRDVTDSRFVAAKIYVRLPPGTVHREQAAYEHLSRLQLSCTHRVAIREVLDSFHLTRPCGSVHHCFIHPPLHMTLFELQRLGGKPSPFPETLVKNAVRYLLEALSYLHDEAKMIHCDIKLSNIMLQIEDTVVLSAFEKAEQTSPSPRKVINSERTIYASRRLSRPRAHMLGPPVLCDFGEARIGTSFAFEEIQPEVYKAPEILLQIEWNSAVDLWNVACLAWEMIQAQHLFDGYDEEGYHNNRVHLGEMVGLLGHPSLAFQRRSEHSTRVFDENGFWRGNPPLSDLSLEDRLTNLEGNSKVEFLRFLRSMLKWNPEERKSAQELLEDPWLQIEPGYS